MAKKVKRVKKVMNMQRRPSAKAAVQAAAQSSSESTTYYVHGPRGILAQKDSSQNWEWMMQDGLGSVRSVVDNSSGVEWSGSPDPFGSYFGEAGTRQTPYGFTGEYTDPITGMVHLRARDYHPALGVFPALDPFEGIANRPMSLNGYSWVEGNVSNAVDPSGMITNHATAMTFNSGNCMQNDPCHQYYGVNSQTYVMCRDRNSLNPCPSGWELYSSCGDRSCFPGPSAQCQRKGSNASISRGVVSATSLWDELWRTQTTMDAQARCTKLRDYAQSLVSSGQYKGREVLSEVIKYAYTNFNYDNSRQLSDDVSCAIVGARGANTLFQASRFGSQSQTGQIFPLGYGGWSEGYDDATDNQAFHFWAYVNSAAQGGSPGALFGDFGHECFDIFDPNGRSISDSRLAIAGIFLGITLANGFSPSQVDDWVDTWLGKKSFNDLVQNYNLEYTLSLLNIRLCPLINKQR